MLFVFRNSERWEMGMLEVVLKPTELQRGALCAVSSRGIQGDIPPPSEWEDRRC